ncbi:MAG: DNA-binding protein [Candidatus Woesearchaeota archaeon]
MKKILLDTNFLLIPYQFKVDIFTNIGKLATFKYGLFVLDKSVEELKNIVVTQRGKDRDAAKIALKLIAIKDVKVINTKSSKRTDDLIIELSSKDGYIVATQDKDLKRRLINHNVRVIVLKQKKVLAIINDKGFD